jgi:hypothetical protein
MTVVDVGIPTHGRPEYFGEAIDSVFRQTLTDWKLTISENGPASDYVAGIVGRHSVPGRVRHVATGRDLGAARNSTLLAQTGSAPCRHPQRRRPVEPEFLMRRVTFLEENRDCGSSSRPPTASIATATCSSASTPTSARGRKDPTEFIRVLYRENVIPISSVVVTRWAYEAVGRYYNESVLYYDWELWAADRQPISGRFLKTCDTQYRVHPAQTSALPIVQLYRAERKLEVLEAVDGALPPGIPPSERRRVRFAACARAGLEAHRRGEWSWCPLWMGRALRTHPAVFADPAAVRYLACSTRLDRSGALSPPLESCSCGLTSRLGSGHAKRFCGVRPPKPAHAAPPKTYTVPSTAAAECPWRASRRSARRRHAFDAGSNDQVAGVTHPSSSSPPPMASTRPPTATTASPPDPAGSGGRLSQRFVCGSNRSAVSSAKSRGRRPPTTYSHPAGRRGSGVLPWRRQIGALGPPVGRHRRSRAFRSPRRPR